ncbi:retrovirus-related pol polyprotein from transposon TNT 1-94 [Tanacetum coccineum]
MCQLLQEDSWILNKHKGRKTWQKNLLSLQSTSRKSTEPTQQHLRTSSTQKHDVDTTAKYKNDNQTGYFGNQRAVNVARARETVGGPVVQQSGIQCFNCKEFCHYAKECRKPKRHSTDEEIDEQELEAHYSYMAKIQEVPNADSGSDVDPLEHVQYDTDDNEVDIIKKTENQAKMTKLSMEWKRLCKIKAKVQKCQSQSQYRRISSQTGAGTEEYYWMQS